VKSNIEQRHREPNTKEEAKPEKPYYGDRSLLGVELADKFMPHLSIKFISRLETTFALSVVVSLIACISACFCPKKAGLDVQH